MADNRVDFEQLYGSVMSRERLVVRTTDAGANVAIATALENADLLDGVALATGDYVLLLNQTTASENGPWEVQATGPAIRPEFWVAGEDSRGAQLSVEAGATNAGALFRTLGSAVIDTADPVFEKFVGAQAVPTKDDKGLAVGSTISGDQTATGLTITNTPANDGYVTVSYNGISYNIGDGATGTEPFYFSANGGTTAKAISAIVGGDELIFNRSVAGFRLKTSGRVDFDYDVAS